MLTENASWFFLASKKKPCAVHKFKFAHGIFRICTYTTNSQWMHRMAYTKFYLTM